MADRATLDHLVLPVPDLDQARIRYEALGFTVAPRGDHPFGTANACVYLVDGTFLEPLAIADHEAADRAMAQGNVFAARNAAFLAAFPEGGFSALVTASENAAGDDAAFRSAGLSVGDMLTFSRRTANPDGQSGESTFRLAFAGDEGLRDLLLFSCERIAVPRIDRSALLRHENGVTRLQSVFLAADEPTACNRLLSTVLRSSSETRSVGLAYRCSNLEVVVLDRDGFEAMAGADMPMPAEPMLVGAAFETPSLAAAAALLTANNVEFNESGLRIHVPPGPGQALHLFFREPQATEPG